MGLSKHRDSGIKSLTLLWYHEYKRTTSNHCVYVKRFSDGDFIILLLYVDDMLIVGHDVGKI